ncbi:hypothetical protein QEZ54_10230 [Catellatospora sp. KI3]|uniref:hypothetical protein n=1 Tax=Catellatospora sp. KI3 TaxID=3041620 RepID=UPI00248213F8|nr:hypothetical protein [Catellatospora sp. KI3]MDI1461345.1 hypothetical protein [Catellatospora sp. KI3]
MAADDLPEPLPGTPQPSAPQPGPPPAAGPVAPAAGAALPLDPLAVTAALPLDPAESVLPPDPAAEAVVPRLVAQRRWPQLRVPRPPARTSRRHELVVAIAIGVATITGAAVTYFSLRSDSAAADLDQQAVIETVLMHQKLTSARSQTHAFSGMAAHYRHMLADADVSGLTDPREAEVARQLARSYRIRTGINQFLQGADATTRFDTDAQYQAALHQFDQFAIADSQPDATAARADAQRGVSRRLNLSVVGLLAVVALLTFARVARRRSARIALVGLSAVGYAAAVTAAVIAAV